MYNGMINIKMERQIKQEKEQFEQQLLTKSSSIQAEALIEFQTIKQIEQTGTAIEKNNNIEFYKQNVVNFVNIFLTIKDFNQFLLQDNSYFNPIFCSEKFIYSFLGILNSNYFNTKFTHNSIIVKLLPLPSVNQLIKTKIEQNPKVFKVVENVLKNKVLFNFTDYVVKYNCHHSFMNIYNFSYHFNDTELLIDYMYYNSEILLESIIPILNTAQQNRLIKLFLFKADIFSYFLIKSDSFFNLIYDGNNFFEILFTYSSVIQPIMETGNIPKLANLLLKKMKNRSVLDSIQHAIYKENKHSIINFINEEISLEQDILYVLYKTYEPVYNELKIKFANDIKFINYLETKLSVPLQINNELLYNELIFKLMGLYLTENDNILPYILDSENEMYNDQKVLDEFINLLKNNSFYIRRIGNMRYSGLLKYDKINMTLPNSYDFIATVFNNKNLKEKYEHEHLFENVDEEEDEDEDEEEDEDEDEDEDEYLLNGFQILIYDIMNNNAEYRTKIKKMIDGDSKNQYDINIKNSCNVIYYKKLFSEQPQTIMEYALSEDPIKKNFFLKVCSNAFQSISNQVISNPDFIQILSQDTEEINKLFLSHDTKDDDEEDEEEDLCFGPKPFIIKLLKEGNNESIAKLVEDKIKKNENFFNFIMKYINPVSNYFENPAFANIVDMYMNNLVKADTYNLINNFMTWTNPTRRRQLLSIFENDIQTVCNLINKAPGFLEMLEDCNYCDSLFTKTNFLEAFINHNLLDQNNTVVLNEEVQIRYENNAKIIKMKMIDNTQIFSTALDLIVHNIGKIPNYCILIGDFNRFEAIDFIFTMGGF